MEYTSEFRCCLDGIKRGERNTLVDLADTLTELRGGKQGAVDYLRALDAVAEAMGLTSKTETVVRYTA